MMFTGWCAVPRLRAGRFVPIFMAMAWCWIYFQQRTFPSVFWLICISRIFRWMKKDIHNMCKTISFLVIEFIENPVRNN